MKVPAVAPTPFLPQKAYSCGVTLWLCPAFPRPRLVFRKCCLFCDGRSGPPPCPPCRGPHPLATLRLGSYDSPAPRPPPARVQHAAVGAEKRNQCPVGILVPVLCSGFPRSVPGGLHNDVVIAVPDVSLRRGRGQAVRGRPGSAGRLARPHSSCSFPLHGPAVEILPGTVPSLSY